MDISEGLRIFSGAGDNAGLHKTLGFEFLSTPDEGVCIARMKVDDRHSQPFGFLNGGATIAMAETLAGLGSVSLCPENPISGMNVNCNHIHSARVGTEIEARARIVHQGHRTHIWDVEVRDESGTLISRITVTNYIHSVRK